VDGGTLDDVRAYDSSSITMSGGELRWSLSAYDSSTVTMSGGSAMDLYSSGSSTIRVNGGTVAGWVYAWDSSTITMSGGTVGDDLYAWNSSTITILGRNFEVNGVPVPYGDLTAGTGTLSGTLASGDPIDNVFYQGGYNGLFTGTITLVSRPVNTPALSPWSQLALAAGLIGAGLALTRKLASG
jgi:hypothetical protein